MYEYCTHTQLYDKTCEERSRTLLFKNV